MKTAVRAGGEILRRWFGAELELTEKSINSDFQTQADRESEAAVLAILTAAFPTYNIHAEESGIVEHDSDYTFYIDPLDGTNNFTLGIAYFSVSLALQRGTETVAAVIYNPITDQLYAAAKGKGAYLNDKRLLVNAETDPVRLTAGYVPGYIHKREFSSALVTYLHRIRNTKRYLSMWSPALDSCLLASGKIEGMIVNNPELYDVLGAKLIIREAGGIITDWKGAESEDASCQYIAANTPAVGELLREAVRYAQEQSA